MKLKLKLNDIITVFVRLWIAHFINIYACALSPCIIIGARYIVPKQFWRFVLKILLSYAIKSLFSYFAVVQPFTKTNLNQKMTCVKFSQNQASGTRKMRWKVTTYVRSCAIISPSKKLCYFMCANIHSLYKGFFP